MNIFAVSSNPNECARALDDQRLNKMIIETGQLLSTALYYWNEPEYNQVYRRTHDNHPVNKWVRENVNHFGWTFHLFMELITERQFRRDTNHKTENLVQPFLNVVQRHGVMLPDTPEYFQNSSFYKSLPVCEAYRWTLIDKWNSDVRPSWTRRGPPEWL
uniref:Uncharacterized protein n=1 Tax=uncultured microorganism TaxID=358574 RepID=A0A2U8U0M1_9ZZZZ|nr:hypothetical protein [uncultured microorganism]